jgi:hypothetical protein
MLESAAAIREEPWVKVTTPKPVATKNAKIANAQTRMAVPAVIEITITMIAPLSIVILPPLASRPGFQLLVFAIWHRRLTILERPLRLKFQQLNAQKSSSTSPLFQTDGAQLRIWQQNTGSRFHTTVSVTGSIRGVPGEDQSEGR